MATAEQYREQLKALLPPGRAISRDPGTTIEKLLHGMADEMARLDARGEQLLVEVNPMTTTDLLAEWERVAGLPDKCAGTIEETMQGRRAALASKLSGTGGQSKSYFIAVAAALGYTVTITEFTPFLAGHSHAGDPLTNGEWAFAWQVNAPAVSQIFFRAGQSTAGEPLASGDNTLLECKMREIKPAHTTVLFQYS